MMFGKTEGKGRILIVDDDEGVRRLLCDALGDSYECFSADSAEEALSNLDG